MPDAETGQPVIDYYTPAGRRSWTGGWAWTLYLSCLATLLLLPGTTGPSNQVFAAIGLAAMAVSIRALIALLRRDRSRWWLAYLLLLIALPAIVSAIHALERTPWGQQISKTLWRSLHGV